MSGVAKQSLCVPGEGRKEVGVRRKGFDRIQVDVKVSFNSQFKDFVCLFGSHRHKVVKSTPSTSQSSPSWTTIQRWKNGTPSTLLLQGGNKKGYGLYLLYPRKEGHLGDKDKDHNHNHAQHPGLAVRYMEGQTGGNQRDGDHQ